MNTSMNSAVIYVITLFSGIVIPTSCALSQSDQKAAGKGVIREMHPEEASLIKELTAIGVRFEYNSMGRVRAVWARSIAELRDDHIPRMDAFTDVEILDFTATNVAHFNPGPKPPNKLQTVRLNGSRIDDEALIRIGKLPSLRRVEFANTKVTSDGVLALKNHAGLRYLNLREFKASSRLCEVLPTIKELRELVAPSEIDDASISIVGSCERLRILGIDSSVVTDKGLEPLRNLEDLQELWLLCPNVRGPGLAWISRLPYLTGVWLEGTSVGCEDVLRLQNLDRLLFLNVSHTNVVRHDANRLREAMPSVRIVSE